MEMEKAGQEGLENRVQMLFLKLFEAAQYREAFLLLHKYNQAEVLPQELVDFIMAAFVEPNLEEIKSNVTANSRLLKWPVDPEKINYYILPTETGFEFILDRSGKKLIQIRAISAEEWTGVYKNSDKFSDYALLLKNGSIVNFFLLAQEIKKINRQLYVIIGPELEALFQMRTYRPEETENIWLFGDTLEFERYFIAGQDYFPRNVIQYDNSPVNPLAEIRERIHAYRLSHKGTKRPLLSIGIPSAERGTFALTNVLHTLQTHFDYEIEVILSDNASVTLPEYYGLIKNMKDSRLVYNRNDSDLGYRGNVKRLIELARAKYLLFNCDTDILKLDKLAEILAAIRDADQEYSQFRIDSEAKVDGNYVESAYDTIRMFSFRSNALFGNIFNVDIIKASGFLQYLDAEWRESEFIIHYYHMAIDLFLESFGHTYLLKDMVISEYPGATPYLIDWNYVKEDEFEDFENFTRRYSSEYMAANTPKKKLTDGFQVGRNKIQKIYRAYTIAGRTAQHISCAKLLRDIFYDKGWLKEFIMAYVSLYNKTLAMIQLNVRYNYLETDLTNAEIIQKIHLSMDYIERENERFLQLVAETQEGKDNVDIELLGTDIQESYDHFVVNINSAMTERFA